MKTTHLRALVHLGFFGLVAASACGTSGADDGEPPRPPQPGDGHSAGLSDPPPEFGQWLFDPNRLTIVELTLDPADWDALRNQTRSFLHALAGDCQAQPFEKPWTYFQANATINGIPVANVGVRKKGFIGSLSTTKPSLKIKFDEFEAGQAFSGLERMTLNNQNQDPSLINACLGYGIFRDAGIVAPRCNFALVTVNGVELGIYAHVDSLRRDFVRQNFAYDDGNLWEGTLSDFRDDWTGTFELKTNQSSAPTDITEITEIAEALKVADADLLASVSSVIDLDQFYTFWATETIVGHWDGHSGNTNNFYFYRNPESDLAEFIPWGADALFRQRFTPYASVQARGQLTGRLYAHPSSQAAYLARVVEILETIWNEPALVAEANRMADLVRPHVSPGALATFEAEIAETIAYINGKHEAVTTELAAGPPAWTVPLREDFCFDRIGGADLTIDTLWNAGSENLGTGTLALSHPQLTQDVVAVRSLAGPLNATTAQLFLSADLDDGSVLLFSLTMPLAEVKAGGAAVIDWVSAAGELRLTPPGGASTLIHRLGTGDITVTSGAITDGAAVRLSVDADLHALGL